MVVASPTYFRIIADVHGRAAHAGIRPENGRSAIVAAARGIAAMRLGRIDPETTANVGTITGGTNANVVAERCHLEAEARSIDPARAESVATEIVDHLQEAADASECDLDVTVERMFEGYRTRGREPQVTLAELALRDCGYEPTPDRDRRRIGRERAAGGRLSVHQPGQRHRAQPRADRARQRRRARRDARGRDRADRACAGGDAGRGRSMSEIEEVSEEVQWEGKFVRGRASLATATPTAPRSRARRSGTRGR